MLLAVQTNFSVSVLYHRLCNESIVLSLLIETKVSGVPVLDETGKVINCYCKTDVTYLAKDRKGTMLERSVADVLKEMIADHSVSFEVHVVNTFELVISFCI